MNRNGFDDFDLFASCEEEFYREWEAFLLNEENEKNENNEEE